MRVAFVSTELTPHQIPLCNNLYSLAEEFYFIQTVAKGDCWVSKGQTIYRNAYEYLRFFAEEKAFCEEKILDADVVIVGGVDLSLVKKRLQKGGLVFVYLERFYKDGITLKNALRVVGGTFLHHGRFQKYGPYLLCASGYCAGDAAIFGNYRARTLKWGYFPETQSYDAPRLISSKESNSIIWVGRLIDWKHPDDMLLAAKQLKAQGHHFQLKIFGDGPMRNALQSLIDSYDLRDCVSLCGNVPNETIRQEMGQASIFISTSDYGEGWGCVVNEAMNSACAVVVSHAAGAVPFLIKDGKNGFIYESGNVDELTEVCAKLLGSSQLCQHVGICAYETISSEWNAQTAAERLIRTSGKIMAKERNPFEEDGPCSYAEPIQQKMMYTRIKNAGCKDKSTNRDDAFSE